MSSENDSSRESRDNKENKEHSKELVRAAKELGISDVHIARTRPKDLANVIASMTKSMRGSSEEPPAAASSVEDTRGPPPTLSLVFQRKKVVEKHEKHEKYEKQEPQCIPHIPPPPAHRQRPVHNTPCTTPVMGSAYYPACFTASIPSIGVQHQQQQQQVATTVFSQGSDGKLGSLMERIRSASDSISKKQSLLSDGLLTQEEAAWVETSLLGDVDLLTACRGEISLELESASAELARLQNAYSILRNLDSECAGKFETKIAMALAYINSVRQLTALCEPK